MCLFYLYANARIEIHFCSNKHETGLVANELNIFLILCWKQVTRPYMIPVYTYFITFQPVLTKCLKVLARGT